MKKGRKEKFSDQPVKRDNNQRKFFSKLRRLEATVDKEIKRDRQRLSEIIVPKWIKSSTRKYLADHGLLLDAGEDYLGGKEFSGSIFTRFFRKGLKPTSIASKLKRYFNDRETSENYWLVTKNYLKRFFYVQDYQKTAEGKAFFDFDSMEDPQPKNYPTEEQKIKAFKRSLKTGKKGRIWDIIVKEEREKESDRIAFALKLLGIPVDPNFRYDVFVTPEMVEFFKERGMQVCDLNTLEFVLSINTRNFFKWYQRDRKKGKSFHLFDRFSEYYKLKNELLQNGISEDLFAKAEYQYLVVNSKIFLEALDSFERPIFLIAHFLKKEHQDIYIHHLSTIKFYLENIQNARSQVTKGLSVYMLWNILKFPLFYAVYEDYLFDGKQYLKVKLPLGRPREYVARVLAEVFVDGLKVQKKLSEKTIFELTAKLLNSLLKGPDPIHREAEGYYYTLSADAVQKLYKRKKTSSNKDKTLRKI